MLLQGPEYKVTLCGVRQPNNILLLDLQTEGIYLKRCWYDYMLKDALPIV